MLDRKLEKCQYPGFSKQTTDQRRELLREFSKTLLDSDKAKEYELALQKGISEKEEHLFLNVPDGYEVTGLLLLLEARQYEDCLAIANSLLERSQKLVNCSKHRLSDLYLVIAYATLEYGKELKSKRYYECSAKILENGLRIIQGKEPLDQIEKSISKELTDITPFRILDLLSRDTDETVRDVGLKMLDDVVTKRGGLDQFSNLYMEDNEFKSFFKQIRYYLTVQEQIDLYQEWSKNGSDTACFLLGISLVACGFTRRKPEKLVEAREVMKKLHPEELKEIITYISLLLGDVDDVSTSSSASVEAENRSAARSSKDVLGRLCSNCREWLEKDVLEGYRDLEGDSDLEAYFSDRDVTSFIEEYDNQMVDNKKDLSQIRTLELNQRFLSRAGFSAKNKVNNSMTFNGKEFQKDFQEVGSALPNKKFVKPFYLRWIYYTAIMLIAGIVFFAIARESSTKKNILQQTKNNKVSALSHADLKSRLSGPSMSRTTYPTQNTPQQYPDKVKLLFILSEWLKIKSKTLAGLTIPSEAKFFATPEALERLKAERNEDESRGEIQRIIAKVIDLQIIDRQSKRVDVDATLSYQDERLNRNNMVIEKTPKYIFKKRYTLVNRDSNWQIR